MTGTSNTPGAPDTGARRTRTAAVGIIALGLLIALLAFGQRDREVLDPGEALGRTPHYLATEQLIENSKLLVRDLERLAAGVSAAGTPATPETSKKENTQ